MRAEVAQQAGELADGLARRQGVAAAHELLELLQDTALVMSKVGRGAGAAEGAGWRGAGLAHGALL